MVAKVVAKSDLLRFELDFEAVNLENLVNKEDEDFYMT